MKPDPMADYVISQHARFEMNRRGLTEDAVRLVLGSPEQRVDVRPGRVVFQSRITMDEPPKMYLVRALVDIDREPAEVVRPIAPARFPSTGGKNREG